MPKKTESPRFLADEMLMRLGRWLRAAGYDVAMLPPGTPDTTLIRAARNEDRFLITRDRKLLEFRMVAGTVILLQSNTTNACARELAAKLPVNWLYRPFSRCMICNHPLEAGDMEDLAMIPNESRNYAQEIWRCPSCERIYWHGSHVNRMRTQLTVWQQINPHVPQ